MFTEADAEYGVKRALIWACSFRHEQRLCTEDSVCTARGNCPVLLYVECTGGDSSITLERQVLNKAALKVMSSYIQNNMVVKSRCTMCILL